jgi:pimeloyl-ACP methyl ester carboxylesterase
MIHPITEHLARTPRHTTFFLACGPSDGVPVIFVHGWPELSISWRHQLPVLGALGFRAIAPDMRGYGRSSIYPRHEDYALRHAVQDMLDLLDHLGAKKAVWVGHDWGAPVVWSLATHHPGRCHGVANLCVPHIAAGFAPANFLPLVDRTTYPEADFPLGQWDYMAFYEENFAAASAAFEANVANTVAVLFRKGNPSARGKPSRTATVRRQGGWFGPGAPAPAVPRDPDVLTEADHAAYTAALARTGFFGPDSWYMNHAANLAYAAEAGNSGRIALPALFLHGACDTTCETIDSRLAEPMRRDCADLEEVTVQSGHWMAQEQPVAVNAALVSWLARRFPSLWAC